MAAVSVTHQGFDIQEITDGRFALTTRAAVAVLRCVR